MLLPFIVYRYLGDCMKKIIGIGLIVCFILFQRMGTIIQLKPVLNDELQAEIKGAVNRPGVYPFKQGDQIEVLIELAGGVNEEADLSMLNQMQYLQKGDLIVIATIGNELISLNTASLEQLMQLKGIGESKAKAIIEYRTINQGFKTIEEIMEVKGIGEKTFAKFKEKLSL